jgi:type IV pilus assembly protein PilX
MSSASQYHLQRWTSPKRQRGVSLFIALIALVALMLASLALIRSVDTSSVIAGNLAFKQAATVSGDRGIEMARLALLAIQKDNASPTAWENVNHVFNKTDAAKGYYSNADSTFDLLLDANWVDAKSMKVAAGAADSAGNTSRYIIQRMCRTADQILSTTNCLFNFSSEPGMEMDNQAKPVNPTSNALYRVTVQIKGPRNTVSYVQAFIF